MPTQNDFYQLVTSRSMWYKHYKLFEQMPRYPHLIAWLKESDNAQSNIEIWGFDRDLYQWSHLDAFLKRGGKPLEISGSESDEVKEQKKKKTHKKVIVKDKGKAKAKEPSSSEEDEDEEEEEVQKSRKKNIASGSRKR